jgi:hypothetical protein
VANDVQRFIDHFGQVPKDLKREIRPELRAAGRLVADEAETRAATFSTKIPRAVKVRVSFAKRQPGVSVIVDKNTAPNARPEEHAGRAGFFRHMVYGHRDRWVSQEAHPFLAPAAEAKADEAARQVEHAVDRVIRKDFEK